MDTYRRTAVVVGILFIIGTVAGIGSAIVTEPLLNDADYLARVATDGNQLVIGALLVLTMGLALALVPIVLFPLARQYNETLALGYVVFRGALEPIAYIGITIPWLALTVLARAYAQVSTLDANSAQILAGVLLAAADALGNVLIILFSLGALMLYALLYQSRLIPRWLSVWGMVAILMYLATAFLLLFGVVGDSFAPILWIFNFPIFLQEMVMAVWLIVKGFDQSAASAPSTRMQPQGV